MTVSHNEFGAIKHDRTSSGTSVATSWKPWVRQTRLGKNCQNLPGPVKAHFQDNLLVSPPFCDSAKPATVVGKTELILQLHFASLTEYRVMQEHSRHFYRNASGKSDTFQSCF